MKLSFQNVCKSYGSNRALQNFTISMTPGVYALLGANGSGKTTLMNIITDNLRADCGEITFEEQEGRPENILNMGVRFRQRLGYMPQYPGMYPNFTVEQFLQYMAVLKNLGNGLGRTEKRSLIERQITDVLRRVELDEVSDRKISSLSGGMKQRLGLAQAVLGNPSVLILDEPTAGLDPKQRITIRNYISEIALNKIVIIATHVVSDVEFIAKEIILLKKGVIVDAAPPQKLVENMDGKVWLVHCAEDDVPTIQNQYLITNISPSGDPALPACLRILCGQQPFASAVPAVPTLEDYYLQLFGEKSEHFSK